MSSKSFASILILHVLTIAGFLLNTGCDRFLSRQGTGRTQQFELKTDALTCLRPVPDRIAAWLRDDLSRDDINTSFDCMRTTVKHFQVRARGTGNTESLTAEDIREYINEALPQNRQIDREFMGHLMRIKTVFLGGSADVLTRPELASILVFLDGFQQQIIGLTGKMRLILFQEEPANVTVEDLRKAEDLLGRTAQTFLEKTQLANARYDISDLHSLAQAFNNYLEKPELLRKLMLWMPFTVSLKELFLGRYVEFSSPSSWKDHIQWVTKGYGSALTFFYRIRPLKFETPEHYDEMISWMNTILDLAETSRSIREGSLLPMPEILQAVNSFVATGVLKTTLTPEDLLAVVPETICKGIANFVEGPQQRSLRCHEVQGITRTGLDIIRHEWSVWVIAQRQIHNAFKTGKTATWSRFRESMRVYRPETVLPTLFFRTTEQADLIRSYGEWKDLMEGFGWRDMVGQNLSTASQYPTLWDPSNRLIVKRVDPDEVLGFSGMTWVNVYRSLTRLVMKGFGTPPPREDRSLFQYTLSRDGLERLESEFRDFGRAIKFLDPRTPNAASRTFLEASFFTPHGRGANSLNAQEVFEELNILVSAGGETSEALYRLMIANNCHLPEFDALARHYLREDCFRDVLQKHFDILFGSVHGLRAITALKPQERKNFDDDLIKVAQPDGEAMRVGKFGFGEIRTLTTVLYYIEIVRLVYDSNRDGKLSKKEVKRAIPRFKSFIDPIIQQKIKNGWGTYLYHHVLNSISTEEAFICLVFEQEDPGFNCLTFGASNAKVGLPELLKVLGLLKATMPK